MGVLYKQVLAWTASRDGTTLEEVQMTLEGNTHPSVLVSTPESLLLSGTLLGPVDLSQRSHRQHECPASLTALRKPGILTKRKCFENKAMSLYAPE